MPHATWLLRDSAAHLQWESLSGVIDPRTPERGLFDIRQNQQSFAGHEILGVDCRASKTTPVGNLIDCYQRRGDLIATYAQTPEQSIRVQVYWRAAGAAESAPVIDLQISVQTSLLDSQPRLATLTRLPYGEVRRLADAKSGLFESVSLSSAAPWSSGPERGPACFLCRWPETDASYLEMAFPGDAHRSEWKLSEAGSLQLKHDLFADSLEKGVIVRSRVRGAYLPRERDEELARHEYAAFLKSTLPLTA